ncbi:MAG TPA: hypothetical protein VF221_02075, partial [Chloroflexota bacterium]
GGRLGVATRQNTEESSAVGWHRKPDAHCVDWIELAERHDVAPATWRSLRAFKQSPRATDGLLRAFATGGPGLSMLDRLQSIRVLKRKHHLGGGIANIQSGQQH